MGCPVRWADIVVPETPVSKPQARRMAASSLRRFALRVSVVCVAVCSGAIAAVIGGLALILHSGSPVVLPCRAAATGHALSLARVSATRRLGYVTVTGAVYNHGSQPLTDVEAVAALVDAHGAVLRSTGAMVSKRTIDSGEMVPFRIDMQDDTHAANCRIRFRRLMGAEID